MKIAVIGKGGREQALVETLAASPCKPEIYTFPGSDAISNAITQGEINVTYRPDEGEFVWPFIEATVGGVNCVKASNSRIDSSYAILYADVELQAGQAVGFDYIISSEKGMDTAIVIVNGNDIYQMSGVDENETWKSCYPWVAEEDGTYEVALCLHLPVR